VGETMLSVFNLFFIYYIMLEAKGRKPFFIILWKNKTFLSSSLKFFNRRRR
jgi:hypothetical protein